MTNFSLPQSAIFSWMPYWNLEKLHEHVFATQTFNERVAFVATPNYRVYLCLGEAGFEYTAHFKCGYMWTPVPAHERRVSLPTLSPRTTEAEIKEDMLFQLTRQFRESIEDGYQEAPAYTVILSTLRCSPRLSTIMSNKLIYSHLDVDTDSGWDGAIQIDCAGGVLQMPYREMSGGELELLPDYAKFVPETPRAVLFLKSLFCRCIEIVSNVHWSTIRSALDKTRR